MFIYTPVDKVKNKLRLLLKKNLSLEAILDKIYSEF